MKPCRQRGALVSLFLVAYKVWRVTLTGGVFSKVAFRISETYGKGCWTKIVRAGIPSTRRSIYIYILWATPSAAGPRPLHSRIADSRHCCKRILAFFGTPACHLRIFGFFGTLGSITKDTLRSRPGFLLISGGFSCPWLLFGCLAPLLWRPGGPWDDPGTILGHWRAQGRTL